MTRVVRLVAIAIAVFAAVYFVPMSWPPVVNAFYDGVDKLVGGVAAARSKRPPKKLRIRPEDYRRYPRQSFGFVLEVGGNRVDAFHGTATKDLVIGPDTTIALALTPAEMDTVYQQLIEMRFFELPSPHPRLGPQTQVVSPRFTTTLWARAGTGYQQQFWTSDVDPGADPSDDWKRLFKVVQLVRRIVEARPEYRALPNPKGAYL